MAAVRHLEFVLRVFGPPTKGIWWSLSLCKNLVGVNTVIFCDLGFKIHAPILWFWGRCDPLNGKQSLRNPQKVGLLPCAKTGRMTYRSSKSIHRCGLGAIPGTKLKQKRSIPRNRNMQQVTCSSRPPTLLHAPCGFGARCREGKSAAE